jgi:hypothetical protein
MVAGLFAAHGVFFGRTVSGDEHNEKGYFEHPELTSRVETGIMANWPDAWWQTLWSEGWNGDPWGVKRGPHAWPWVRALFPDLIVVCKRPRKQVVRSRLRRWPKRNDLQGSQNLARAEIERISREAACPVVTVYTDRVIAGDYGRIAETFETFGLKFSLEIADEWIDRTMWDRGPIKQEALG